MSWQEYVAGIVGDMTNRVISDRTGVSEGTASRWRNGKIKTPDATQAADFARGFERPVLEAFVAAEFLTAGEAAQRPVAAFDPDRLSDDDLLDLVRVRMKRGSDGSGNAAPMKQPPADGSTGGVVHMPTPAPPLDVAADEGEKQPGFDSQGTSDQEGS